MEAEYQEKRLLLIRLPHEKDLLECLNDICREKGIDSGVISVIGAVKSAAVGFYNQETRKYQTINFDRPLEIASCTGNVSLKDSSPIAHMHIVFSDENGAAIGGHLMPGTIIFAAEASIMQLEGQALNRQFDSTTGLPLWS